MSDNIKIATDPDETLFQSIKKNMSWKMGVCLAITAFIIYPRPFLYLLKPFLRRVSKSYSQSKPKLNRIFLTTEKAITPEKLIKQKLYNGSSSDIQVVNLLQEVARSSQRMSMSNLNRTISNTDSSGIESPLELKADNAALKIKLLMIEANEEKDQDYAILIKGSPQLLRLIQARIYGFELEEYYKIPMFTSRNDIHILEAGRDCRSFQHKVIKINL